MTGLRSPRSVVLSLLLAGGCSSTTDAPPQQMSTVGVSAPDTVLIAGDSMQFTASAITASGVAISGRSIQWSSSDTTKATTSASGFVLGRTEGPVTISATIEAVTGSRTIRIKPTLGLSDPISPRGRLLLSRDGRIATMKLDGSDIRYLSGGHGQYSVSADGNWIVYYSNPELIVMKSDGTSRKTIATTTGSFVQPSWTPDGSAIAVQEFLSGGDAITTYSRDGTKLSSFFTDDAFGLPRSSSTTLLRGVTNDGRLLLWRQPGNVGLAGGEVATVNRDGTQLKILGNGWRPRLSPDGTKASYACNGACVVNTDGTGAKKIWNEATEEVWISPGNQRVAFPCSTGPICITTIDGVLLSSLSNAVSGGAQLQLAWSVSGNTIYYRCQFVTGGGNSVSTRYDICRIDTDNTNFANLLNDPNDDGRPTIVETVGQSKH